MVTGNSHIQSYQREIPTKTLEKKLFLSIFKKTNNLYKTLPVCDV